MIQYFSIILQIEGYSYMYVVRMTDLNECVGWDVSLATWLVAS